jgi:hypothetical protein
MPNTIDTKVYRDKYRQASLDKLLRKALVASAICEVDYSGAKTIQNPYGSQPSATVQVLTGTYSPATFTTTDDTLTVNQEFIVAEHIFDFEESLTRFDLFADRTDEQNFAVAAAIDKYVLNVLVANAGQSYTAPFNGFQTAANLPTIVSNLLAKVAGFSDMYKGTYLVLEADDLTGVIEQMAGSGFTFADVALNNGFVKSYMGVDLYVVRPATFATYSAGSESFTNQGYRLFGVKKTTTYAAPGEIRFEEKGVSGKTGQEVVTYCYCGAKVWASKADLTIAINANTSSASTSLSPSKSPSKSPSLSPSKSPSLSPSKSPSLSPSISPSVSPS